MTGDYFKQNSLFNTLFLPLTHSVIVVAWFLPGAPEGMRGVVPRLLDGSLSGDEHGPPNVDVDVDPLLWLKRLVRLGGIYLTNNDKVTLNRASYCYSWLLQLQLSNTICFVVIYRIMFLDLRPYPKVGKGLCQLSELCW